MITEADVESLIKENLRIKLVVEDGYIEARLHWIGDDMSHEHNIFSSDCIGLSGLDDELRISRND